VWVSQTASKQASKKLGNASFLRLSLMPAAQAQQSESVNYDVDLLM
jgi:hypothetical protein